MTKGRVDLAADSWVQPTYVYRVYGHTDDLLYVGMTDDLSTRLRAHRRKPWCRHASHVEWDLWSNREDAAREEWRLIRTYRPPHNISMNEDDFYEPVAPKRRACGL